MELPKIKNEDLPDKLKEILGEEDAELGRHAHHRMSTKIKKKLAKLVN